MILRKLQARLTVANTLALIALFAALGGTGYAAVALPQNSVGPAQIRKNAVGAPEIKRGAVGASEVKNRSLTKADIAPGARKGDVLSATVQFEQALVDLADGAKASYNAFCPAGQRAIGGGFRGDVTESEETNVSSSRPAKSSVDTEPPLDGGTFLGWRITVTNLAGGVTTGILPEVWVVCIPLPSTG